MSCAGVLLTGGASRRFGRDKATLVIDGETLAERTARVLGEVCDPVVEAGPGVSGLRAFREDPPGGGPLAGLLAATAALASGDAVLVLACDLPLIDAPVLQLIAAWPGERSVIPTVDGHPQYACARYSAAAIDRARTAGAKRLRDLAAYGAMFIDEGVWGTVARPEVFKDVDTPDDLDSLGL